MRGLKRNMQSFWYCLYDGSTEIEDEYGNKTGEPSISYKDAVQMFANISTATGQSRAEQFGDLEDYDKVIVTTEMDCPIDENTVLFIDKEPDYDTETIPSNEETDTHDGDEPEPEPVVIKHPKYDYIVKRVAKSINSISIAVQKVKVG